MHLIYALIIVGAILPTTLGIDPGITNSPGCYTLQSQLYCFGGNDLTKNGQADTHFFLDLSSALTISLSQTSWKAVPNPAGFKLPNTENFAFSTLPNNSFLVTGGVNVAGTAGSESTSVFHAPNNSWVTASTQDPFLAVTQTTATMTPDGNVWLWGGNNTIATQTTNYDNVYKFQNAQQSWTVVQAPFLSGLNRPTLPKMSFASASPNNEQIYYLGGIAMQDNNTNNVFADTTKFVMFDTQRLQWSLLSVPGPGPSPRADFTLTYLPSSNLFLLFGGATEQYKPSTDYCWTYDLNARKWQQITDSLQALEYGAGARFSHSAVLVDDRYLFILYGTATNTPASDFRVLDTTNWTWIDQWPGAGNAQLGGSSQNGSLSKGAIAGISIGAIAGLSGLVSAAYWFKRRRNNNRYNAWQDNKSSSSGVNSALHTGERNDQESTIVSVTPVPLYPSHIPDSHFLMPMAETDVYRPDSAQGIIMKPDEPDR